MAAASIKGIKSRGFRLQAEEIEIGDIMVKDPVCGMTIDEKTAAGKSEYKGKTYYFCAPVCKTTFDADPAKYAGAGR